MSLEHSALNVISVSYCVPTGLKEHLKRRQSALNVGQSCCGYPLRDLELACQQLTAAWEVEGRGGVRVVLFCFVCFVL